MYENIKKGIETLKESILYDTQKGENCFNESGCDHIFYKYEPETNQKLIEMGFTNRCIHVSKCSHKYCDKYKWIIERAKHYAEKTGRTYEEIIEIWERNRTYSYMNYYQDCNQPLNGVKINSTKINDITEQIKHLENEINVYDFLSTTLTYDHQKSVKYDILNKVSDMKKQLLEYESRKMLYEINCF